MIQNGFFFIIFYFFLKSCKGTVQGLAALFRFIDDKLPRKRKKCMLISKRMRGFVPHSWLSKTWNEIHGAKIVEIHELKGKSQSVT